MFSKNLILLISFFFCVSLISAQTNPKNEVFVFSELQLNNGTTIKLKDLKGKVILLDFWYRSCLPCLKATPDLIKLQQELKGDLIIIGINDIDDADQISDYYAYKKVNYLSTFKSSKSISEQLKIRAFPTFIIFDTEGKKVYQNIGFNKKELKRIIRRLIKNK